MTCSWTAKCWGRTRCVFDSDVFCGHELEVKEGGFCSVHRHEARANRFRVESGIIAVVVFWAWQTEITMLTAGKTLDVPSLVMHQFRVYQSGRVWEDYWADRGGTVRKDDIVRLSEGGMVENIDEFKRLTKKQIRG